MQGLGFADSVPVGRPPSAQTPSLQPDLQACVLYETILPRNASRKLPVGFLQ